MIVRQSDTTDPVVTLLGVAELDICQGTIYLDAGASDAAGNSAELICN